jgi:hypothetical protein
MVRVYDTTNGKVVGDIKVSLLQLTDRSDNYDFDTEDIEFENDMGVPRDNENEIGSEMVDSKAGRSNRIFDDDVDDEEYYGVEDSDFPDSVDHLKTPEKTSGRLTRSPTRSIYASPNLEVLSAENLEPMFKNCFDKIREAFVKKAKDDADFEHVVFVEAELMKGKIDSDLISVLCMGYYVELIIKEPYDVKQWAISLALANKQKTKYEKFTESLDASHV